MKTVTVRLPDALMAEIEAQARLSTSSLAADELAPAFQAIAHLVGSVKGLPADLSSNKKKYLNATGYGLKRPR
jgi:hypothetical protein